MTINEFLKSIPSAWRGHENFAWWLVEEMKPKKIVELGTDYGYSAFALAYPNIGRVYTIDSFEGDIHTGKRNSRNFFLDKLALFENTFGERDIWSIRDSFDSMAQKWNPSKKIDILHIDGLHTYEAVKNDFETWRKFLHEDSVVLFHDTRSFEGVKRFFNELIEDELLPNTFQFFHSSGLGVWSKNDDIIQKIHSKYLFKNEISLGFIDHNREVFYKHLEPSIVNTQQDFMIYWRKSNSGNPAKLYNEIIDQCDTKYLLLVHQDVNFSPDFLDYVNYAINIYPDFGAMGTVGNFKNNIEWGRKGVINEVTTLDGQCILINKEHGIRFDEDTFDEYHLYVDDYCMQCKEKGLRVFTFPVDAAEAGNGYEFLDDYTNSNCYFRHHSATVNERGYSWGRYNEYLEKFNKKWKI